MATAYASKTSYSGGFGGTAGTTMALPSGSTAGELFILFYGYAGSSSSDDTVEFFSNAGAMPELTVNGEIEFADSGYTGSFFGGARYFFANATDISNGTIEMNSSDSFGYTGYAELYRISGSTNSSLISASYDTVTGATPSFDNDVTGVSSSGILLLMSITASTGATVSASGYAVTTDNPTWTELIDTTADSGSGQRVGIHTAYSNTRTSSSSTGNSSISFASGDAGTTTYCVMVSIGNPDSVTVSIDTPGTLSLSQGGSHDFILGNVFSIDTPGILTLSGADNPIIAETRNVWTEETKNSTTWTEETK